MSYGNRLARKSISRSTGAVSAASAGRSLVDVGRRLGGGVVSTTLARDGTRRPGNLKDDLTEFTFESAGVQYLVTHRLGFTTKDFSVESPSGPGFVSAGSRGANERGIWLVSDTAGLKVRIRFTGQKEDR
jgi:hypothetical protein